MPALLVIVFVALEDALMPEKVIKVVHVSLKVAGTRASVIEVIFIEHLGFTEISPVKRDPDIRELLAMLVMPSRSASGFVQSIIPPWPHQSVLIAAWQVAQPSRAKNPRLDIESKLGRFFPM